MSATKIILLTVGSLLVIAGIVQVFMQMRVIYLGRSLTKITIRLHG